jgi:CDP-diacylglycerol--serine O-phosphatidyltransferase
VSEPEPKLKKTPRQKAFAVLPTLLTLGNAVCGFGAITVLAGVGQALDVVPGDPVTGLDPAGKMVFAAQLIFVAMLFDALDGSAARLTNQTSEFGAMLDSLCDVVSFGVAPAFMMLKLTDARHRLMETLSEKAAKASQIVADASQKLADVAIPEVTEVVDALPGGLDLYAPFDYPIKFLWAIAALYMACAILRLARFNVETDEEDSHDGFSGLPSPAAAAVIASFPIGVMALKEKVWPPSAGTGINADAVVTWAEPVARIALPTLAVLLPFITLATAVLMVSRVPYPHVFNQILKGNQGRLQLLQFVFTLALIFVIGGMTVPVIFCWFAFAGPVQAVWRRYLKPLVQRAKPVVPEGS